MKQWWLKYSARVDALSLRERLLLFVSVMACCFALADVLWLSPAQSTYKALSQRVSNEGAELGKLRDELRQAAPAAESGKAVRLELARLQAQVQSLDAQIAAASSLSDQATPLREVMVHFLRRHERLSLVRVATMAPAPSTPAGSAARAERAGAGADLASLGLVRQGVELTVAGPYAELARYVQTLESALPSLRWGPMKLVSEQQVPQLTLQVYLVGVQP